MLDSSDSESRNLCGNSTKCKYANFQQKNLSSYGDQEVAIHLCSNVYEIGAQDVVTFIDISRVRIFGAQGGSTLLCQTGTTGLQC